MSDAVLLEGKEYISSKRASELSGYAQDYIGQLARKGLIDAQRVGGLWHISMASLSEYKAHAVAYVPQQPERKEQIEVGSLISFDGKDHISAARAAEITGYHPDYVGQLARSGGIISRQVGNRWYIDREGILAHKKEKDGLLGAVQARSVGLPRAPIAENITKDTTSNSEDAYGGRYSDQEQLLIYTKDESDLLPLVGGSQPIQASIRESQTSQFTDEEYPVPIRRVQAHREHDFATKRSPTIYTSPNVRPSSKTIDYRIFGKFAASALTIVIVLSFGFVTLKDSSVYSTKNTEGAIVQRSMFTASAASGLYRIQSILENIFSKELHYKRVQ